MKKAVLILAFCLATIISQAQTGYSDNQAKEMLREFYIAYNAILNSGLQPTAIEYKLDSLRGRYCTKAFNKKLDNTSRGSDAFIGDDGITTLDLLKKTINIAKDPTTENEFIVSYMSHNPQVGKPTELKVFLQLTVIKEQMSIKYLLLLRNDTVVVICH